MQRNKHFVDTNLFLRYLTNDIPEQAIIFSRLIQKAQNGELLLVTNTLVIAEIAWTLKSFYKFPKKKIDQILNSIVASNAIEIEEREILHQAIEDYSSLNIDFNDAYISAWMRAKNINRIFTLNAKHFLKIPGIVVSDLEL